MGLQLVKDDAPLEEEPLEALIERFWDADETAKRTKERRDKLSVEVSQRLASERHKAKDVPVSWDPTKKIRAVRSANARIVLDDAGLKKALGAKVWHTITEEKASRVLLETAITEGKIEHDLVRPYIKREEHPSVRLYFIENREETTDDDGSGQDD